MNARIAALFRPPFKRFEDTGYIYDADGDTAVTDFHNKWGPVARGWGRIQYLTDGEALFDEWEEFFDDLTGGDETNLDEIAELLNLAWPADPPPKLQRPVKRTRSPQIPAGARVYTGIDVGGIGYGKTASKGCRACFDLTRATSGRVKVCSKCARGRP